MDDGAVGFHTLSEEITHLNKDEWLKFRTDNYGLVCGLPGSFAEMKSEIEQFCNINPCNYETINSLNKLIARMNLILPAEISYIRFPASNQTN